MKIFIPDTLDQAEGRRQRNEFLKKNVKKISEVANGTTPMDALKKGNPLLALGRVAKYVDDSMVDPAIRRFKGLMNKVTGKK